MNQRTISRSIRWEGKGIHTGQIGSVVISPAAENHGIKWYKDDSDKPILHSTDSVLSTNRSTDIGDDQGSIKTIEHLLAALHALGISNCEIRVDGPEIPILDGACAHFYDDLRELILEQDAVIAPIKIQEKIEYRDPSTGAHYTLEPADDLQISVRIDFGVDRLGEPAAEYNSSMDFRKEIAPCRTFVRSHEIPYLVSHGLIQGGDLERAIVFYTAQTDDELLMSALSEIGLADVSSMVNKIKEGPILHFNNEPARHKILDLYGDLYLLGRPILGKITVTKPGHTSNIAFAKKIKSYI